MRTVAEEVTSPPVPAPGTPTGQTLTDLVGLNITLDLQKKIIDAHEARISELEDTLKYFAAEFGDRGTFALKRAQQRVQNERLARREKGENV